MGMQGLQQLKIGQKDRVFITILINIIMGFPWQYDGKVSVCQCRRHKRCGFDPWNGKIPQSRKWQPTPLFLPGESLGQRSLVGYSPWGCKESDRTKRLIHFQKKHQRSYKTIHLAVLGKEIRDTKSLNPLLCNCPLGFQIRKRSLVFDLWYNVSLMLT